MCCTKAAVKKTHSEEDDGSFERIDDLNHLEVSDNEDENLLMKLEMELAEAKDEIMQLKRHDKGWDYNKYLCPYLIGLLILSTVLLTSCYRLPHCSACSASPPPITVDNARIANEKVVEGRLVQKTKDLIKEQLENERLRKELERIEMENKQLKMDSNRLTEKCESERRDVTIEHHDDFTYGFGMIDGFITEVERHSNAERAGLQVGDEILVVNGWDIQSRVEWGIYDVVCDPAYHESDKFYRSIRGFYPQDCLALRTTRHLRKDIKLGVRRNPGGYRRLQAAGVRYFKLGAAAASIVIFAIPLASALFHIICRISKFFAGNGSQ